MYTWCRVEKFSNSEMVRSKLVPPALLDDLMVPRSIPFGYMAENPLVVTVSPIAKEVWMGISLKVTSDGFFPSQFMVPNVPLFFRMAAISGAVYPS